MTNKAVGNRVSTKEYAYTLTNTLGTAVTTIGATYNSVLWSDKMTAYNGKTVSYDSIGSVTSYDGWDYTWSNRQLKQIKNDDTRICYGYDANGLRTLKVVYDLTQSNKGEAYRYIWKDGKISFVKYTDWVVTTSKDYYSYIIYDGDEPMGMLVNSYSSYLPIQNNTFLFVKNLQGDVIGIVDENGNTLVTYNYDAWGNVSCTVNPNYAVLGELVKKINPFTYRCYNYDYEIGLYYLQSRYYNPEWGRFISSDIYLETGTGVLGSNVFTYCDNNCVNYYDNTGYFKAQAHFDYTAEFSTSLFGKHYGNIMAKGSYDIDELYPPVAHFYDEHDQSFHFNINGDGTDSRDERTSELCRQAWCYVDDALEYRSENNMNLYRTHLEGAFYFFGQALHPQQDKIAHSGTTGDIKIGVSRLSFHMHLLDDDNINGIYYHPIFNMYMTKNNAVQIDTLFIEIIIYAGLDQRGINVKQLQLAS